MCSIISSFTNKEAEVQMLHDSPNVRSLAPGTAPPDNLGSRTHSLPLLPLLLIKTSMGATGDQRLQQMSEDSLDGEVIAE